MIKAEALVLRTAVFEIEIAHLMFMLRSAKVPSYTGSSLFEARDAPHHQKYSGRYHVKF